MNKILRNVLLAAGIAVAGTAAAQVTLFSNEGFSGHSFTADRTVRNFANRGFNDRAESAIVRGGPWQVCVDAGFQGRCMVLQPGRYASLRRLGLTDKISSVRQAGEQYGRNGNDYYARNGEHRNYTR